MKIRLHQKAPNFELPDQDSVIRSLADYLGRWVLLYFYPKDDTPGCTKEACMLRDDFHDFTKIKAEILGVSVDSVASHKKFEQKYDLPFTLLSDEKKAVVKKYGVWAKKKFIGRSYEGTLRTSFLIDPEGNVVKVYEGVNPAVHAEEVIRDLKVFARER